MNTDKIKDMLRDLKRVNAFEQEEFSVYVDEYIPILESWLEMYRALENRSNYDKENIEILRKIDSKFLPNEVTLHFIKITENALKSAEDALGKLNN